MDRTAIAFILLFLAVPSYCGKNEAGSGRSAADQDVYDEYGDVLSLPGSGAASGGAGGDSGSDAGSLLSQLAEQLAGSGIALGGGVVAELEEQGQGTGVAESRDTMMEGGPTEKLNSHGAGNFWAGGGNNEQTAGGPSNRRTKRSNAHKRQAVLDPCKDVAVMPFQANGGLWWGSPIGFNAYANAWDPAKAAPLNLNFGAQITQPTGGGFNIGGWPHVMDLSHLCTQRRRQYAQRLAQLKARQRPQAQQIAVEAPPNYPADWWMQPVSVSTNQQRIPWYIPNDPRLVAGRNTNDGFGWPRRQA